MLAQLERPADPHPRYQLLVVERFLARRVHQELPRRNRHELHPRDDRLGPPPCLFDRVQQSQGVDVVLAGLAGQRHVPHRGLDRLLLQPDPLGYLGMPVPESVRNRETVFLLQLQNPVQRPLRRGEILLPDPVLRLQQIAVRLRFGKATAQLDWHPPTAPTIQARANPRPLTMSGTPRDLHAFPVACSRSAGSGEQGTPSPLVAPASRPISPPPRFLVRESNGIRILRERGRTVDGHASPGSIAASGAGDLAERTHRD